MSTPWDDFYNEKLKKVFSEKKEVIDIGGGLRVIKEKNNKYEPRNEWLRPHIKMVNYKIMDPVDTYNPDIVGDIYEMPFSNNSLEAIICIAVLEHVENPLLAAEEMYRTLKPGGYCFVYVPFLYYHHAEEGYYGDYWRFTPDSIEYIFKKFSKMEIAPVRGALETWIHLSPLGRWRIFNAIFGWLDRITGKIRSKQVSGYYVFMEK